MARSTTKGTKAKRPPAKDADAAAIDREVRRVLAATYGIVSALLHHTPETRSLVLRIVCKDLGIDARALGLS